MNNYGVIVNQIGMRPLIDDLQRTYIRPLARLLFPIEGGAVDSHHSFMVQYREGEDLGLDMHHDDSDVTLNVCLGRHFTGATLSFCGGFGQPGHRKHVHTYSHERGRGILHLGSHRHGADDIASGERYNLIVWSHNSAWRASEEYQRATSANHHGADFADGQPDPICLSCAARAVPHASTPAPWHGRPPPPTPHARSAARCRYTHDPDYAEYKVYPKGKGAKPGARERHVKQYDRPAAAARASELKEAGTGAFKRKEFDEAAARCAVAPSHAPVPVRSPRGARAEPFRSPLGADERAESAPLPPSAPVVLRWQV
jgi:hypothetical protein